MATIVMITGTNATGKTTLAKALIKRFGGIAETRKDITLCNDRRVVFLGRYADSIKYGGVDMLNETKCLETITQDAISKGAEYIFAEGVYLKTFGLNIQRFLFCAKKTINNISICPFIRTKQPPFGTCEQGSL